jgi:hypothetical protein
MTYPWPDSPHGETELSQVKLTQGENSCLKGNQFHSFSRSMFYLCSAIYSCTEIKSFQDVIHFQNIQPSLPNPTVGSEYPGDGHIRYYHTMHA